VVREHSVAGTELDRARIAELLERSVMLVTALSPAIGYDHAAEIAHRAMAQGITLREAAVGSGAVTEQQFQELVDPAKMVGGGLPGA